ncbi:MAG: glutamate--tRNA ligase [bacterium]|nr:glutamate--tRNA ligase [bacterium]
MVNHVARSERDCFANARNDKATKQTIRVRFAPSPTGYLHVGGARSALFNWLFARHQKGIFILRIEDTDAARSTEESTRAILDSMVWLGLDLDEGPFFQSERTELYRKYVQKLLDENKAYYCFCSPEVLEEKRKKALAAKLPPKYDGTCTNLPKEEALNRLANAEKAAVRFRKLEGFTEVNDLVRGLVTFDNRVLDDFILLRSDGSPIYNLTVVVDDIEMKMTHIIRGDEHLSNTPRQLMLYQAFGQPVPQFAHVSMILAPDKTKLSKRHGATSVLEFRDQGYLPEALMNYLALLGWAYDDKSELFSKEELIAKFSLDKVSKNPAVFDHNKLAWMNRTYLRQVSLSRLEDLVVPLLKEKGYAADTLDKAWLHSVLELERQRARTTKDIAANFDYYLADRITIEPDAAKKHLESPDSRVLLFILATELDRLEPYNLTTLEQLFAKITTEKGVKLGKLVHPTRVALTGKTVGPGIFELLQVIGRETAIKRIRQVLNKK